MWLSPWVCWARGGWLQQLLQVSIVRNWPHIWDIGKTNSTSLSTVISFLKQAFNIYWAIMKIKCKTECLLLVTQSYLILWDLIDCSLSGSSVHEILKARILEWVASLSSRGIFPTQGSYLDLLHCRWVLYRLSHQGSRRKIENSDGISKEKLYSLIQ